MNSSLLILLLSLASVLQISGAASMPPLNHSLFSKPHSHLRNSADPPPKQYVEITRPLAFDSLTPSCTLPILSHTFSNTSGLPPTNATYSPPLNCTWSSAVLHLSAASKGSQYDRIAAVWLSGAELLRTSTPRLTSGDIFWNVEKDMTRYSSLLRQSNITLSVMLENVVDDFYTGVCQLNLTFFYYDIGRNGTSSKAVYFPEHVVQSNQESTIGSLDLDSNPADLIIPISAIGDEGFWFKIERESDAVYQGIKIPLNTYRAVVEVYVSSHGDDECWYSNPPDAYIEMNNLATSRGHGTYREVLVKIDDNVVGSAIPFPVIFSGGINPLFWEPVVSIGAFNLPSYEIELTPFLAMLLDGKVHFFGLGVADAIPFWLVNANLHLWLDDKVDQVQAGAIKYVAPDTCVEREYKFQKLDGKFEVEGERKSEFSGWVNYTAGNLTFHVTHKLEFENTIKFSNDGKDKEVEQEVKVKSEMKVEARSRGTITSTTVERKYPLEIKTSTLPGSVEDSALMATKLEQSLEEEKSEGKFRSKLANSQKAKGWVFVEDHHKSFFSGAATTQQRYSLQDSYGRYNRQVLAANGYIKNDTTRPSSFVFDQ